MKIGLSFDLKQSIIPKAGDTADALEEYDSVETVEVIKKSLESAGHCVSMLGGGREFISGITNNEIDIVFNIAEGRGNYRSREAQVPGILEMLGIPYSGSDPLTLSVCLDKPLTKKLVSLEGIATPKWRVIKDENSLNSTNWRDFPFPAIIKPAFEGSSKGIHRKSLVHNLNEAFAEIISQLKDYRQPIMTEEFIDGDEVTVGIIGNNTPEIVGLMRILPREKTEHFVYSVEVKRDWQRLVEYECPAKINSAAESVIREYSLKSYDVLGCRDFTRIDFRINTEGIPFFLEINPLPGLGWYSDLIIMAKKLGWSHEGLITSVFDAALERYPQLVCA